MLVSHRLPACLLAIAVCLGAGACSCTPPGTATDLLRAADALTEASVAGRSPEWVHSQIGNLVRINDVARRTLPASPPSRLRFVVDVPRRATLHLACGISPKRYDQPGIEFSVTIGEGPSATRVWSQIVDPLKDEQHRRWLPIDIDLSGHAGRGQVLVLETRGFAEDDDSAAAFWGTPTISTRQRAPLAIIYLVDTLRADHTSPYGYERDTTPALTALARDSVLFEQAIVQASWTKPSIASLMTSMIPSRHGVAQLRDTLAGDLTTLAELLSARGFATSSVSANVVVYGAGTGFEQGFDLFAGLHGADDRPSKSVPAVDVIDAALAAVEARRGIPHFLFVHTMDPHVPYTPPPPYDRLYEPHPTPGHPGVDPRTDFHEPEDRDRIVAQYDGEIAYGDAEMARFVAALKQHDLYNEALLIFTSDHGEEFLDHEKWLHGRSVYDELVRVPLVVKLPGNRHAGLRVGRQVQGLDVLPTVLEALGAPIPSELGISGVPLQAVIAGTVEPRIALSEVSHRRHVSFGARSEDLKYIERYSPLDDPVFGPVRKLLFALGDDPHERENVLPQREGAAAPLRTRLTESVSASPYATNLRIVGPGAYRIDLRTDGRIEELRLQPVDQGDDDSAVTERPSAQEAHLSLSLPRRGVRELSFVVWPRSAPVWLSGARNKRELRPADVFMGDKSMAPEAMPALLPESEPEATPDTDAFAPPPHARPGIHVWLTAREQRGVMGPMDAETCAQMQALGYVECPQP